MTLEDDLTRSVKGIYKIYKGLMNGQIIDTIGGLFAKFCEFFEF